MRSEPEIDVADWIRDRDKLLAIRFEVFVEEQGVPSDMEEDRFDPVSLHLLASFKGSGPVGTGRLLPDGHIGRMAVRRPFRSQGIGSALLMELIHHARITDKKTLTLNAQCSAVSFYERFGFLAKGEVFEEAGIPHQRMQLQLSSRSLSD